MKKTIAIIELYQHDEVLRHYCDLLSAGDYNIIVFCSKTVFENIKDCGWVDKVDWYINEAEASIPEFLYTSHAAIQGCDLVFVTTALSHFKAFYELSKLNKTLLLVHNAHAFLAPGQSLYFQQPLPDRLRWMKVMFNRFHFYQKKMLKTVFAFAFPTETILDYVKESFEVHDQLKLLSLPFAYYRQREKIQSDKITITIPCTVVSGLRDYDSVLHAFLQLKQKLKENIRLVLLGKPKKDGKKIIENFQVLTSDKIEVVSFDKFIPTAEYEQWLLSSDFMLLPLKAYGRYYIYKERMGYSKISGSINDMIRFGIPSLIANTYPLENQLLPMTDSYMDADDLAEKIINWIENKIYLGKKAKASECLQEYSMEHMAEKLDHVLQGLLNP